jgi:putative alpha-1,2-mannosidase
MIGNDDCGQMSAWYIFSTLGFYPANPAGDEFVLGIPQVKKAIVKLANQKQLSIESQPNHKNMSIELDENLIQLPTIKFEWINSGGSLVFKNK